LVRFDVFAPTWVGRAALEEAIARTAFMAQAGGLGSFAKLVVADYESPLDVEVGVDRPIAAEGGCGAPRHLLSAPSEPPSSGGAGGTFDAMGAALADARGGN
jgi:hypothetical protein